MKAGSGRNIGAEASAATRTRSGAGGLVAGDLERIFGDCFFEQFGTILEGGSPEPLYLPSYAGFGLPVLEAMQAGVRVICSNRASLPEVGGEAALYVDPFDVEGFVYRMRTVMTDDVVWADRRRMALENVRRFSWNRTATLTRDVYGEAVSAASC